MTNEICKTISTCTIWIATAVIFTCGLFRMNGDPMFFLVATGMIAGSALAATAMIWRPLPQPKVDESPASSAATAG